MDDDQKDLTEDQRLQQAQGSNSNSGTPAGGQSSFSADYSTAQGAQDSGELAQAVEADTVDEAESGLVGDDSESVNSDSIDTPSEENEDDDTSSMMNDFAEDDFEDDFDEEDTEEETDEDIEDIDEIDEIDEESSDLEDQSEEDSAVTPGTIIGSDRESTAPDSSIVGADQESISDGSSDLETGDIPAPDLTPETDSTSVDAVIDGAFADFNSGDSDTGDVLGNGSAEQ